jgi:hypothetical protein
MNRTTKATAVILLCLGVSISGYSQKKEKMSKKLPPIEMLPKVGEGKKEIYELPKETDYKVFDVNGQLKAEGSGQFIDITDYDSGSYFVRYKNKTIKIEKS